jgi:antitoxin YefM
VVTHPGHEPLTLLPSSELEGLRGTVHLLGSPANAERLFRSIQELEQGQSMLVSQLLDPDALT